jgi:GntR family transcriptional regulator
MAATTSSVFAAGAVNLDRDGDDPLWLQLEGELRRRLNLGHFGERFPTDRELMQVYGVSRHTARHAVDRLGSDGIVRRSRGVGTSVDTDRIEQSLGSLYSLFQVVEASGLEQESTVLSLEVGTDAVAAHHLGLAPDTSLVHLSRLRLAGGEPLAIDRTWLPESIAGELLQSDFTHTSLYNELERCTGHRPSAGWEQIRAVVPEPSERRLLGIDTSEAVFCINRLGVADGINVEWRTTLIRSDRFSFVADWTMGQRSELRPEHRPTVSA